MTFGRACVLAAAGLMLAATAGSQTVLDTLFDKLRTATDPSAVQALEQGIWEQWTMVSDPAQRRLMMRGIAEMQQQELQSALATFTKLIDTAPELSEAWNKRATVYWLLGNFPASINDICETVKREPRHFGAYSGLGMIRAQMGEHARAAAAFELAKKWNPHIVGIDAEIERQKAEAGGQVSDDPLGCGQRTAGR
ncbi:MAG: tetratricopeptide repeat protein [Proteobacteria bacterium]|nr:tetratricopeptide repeat protein [Pseudomonadota bacterium]